MILGRKRENTKKIEVEVDSNEGKVMVRLIKKDWKNVRKRRS